MMPDARLYRAAAALTLFMFSAVAYSDNSGPIGQAQTTPEVNYRKYCALCHGEDREGYANDHAPSLRSLSLMTSGAREVLFATAYGRFGTPMAGYLDELGGPMTFREIVELTMWLRDQVGADPYKLSPDAVTGDINIGRDIYAENCSSCHGDRGQGGTGTALGNQAMLSLTSDAFLKYAIVNGRDGTEMPAFGDVLSEDEINGVTAFLRSRSTGWAIEKPILRSPPQVGDYVINPESPRASFELKDDLYVTSADLLEALRSKKRLILLDTRSTSQWQVYNIEGSVPIPYYSEYSDLGAFLEDLPNDGTMIVTYCACPRAAAERVNSMIQDLGFTNTAVLWEGIRGWVSLGYPVFRGESGGEVNTAAMEPGRFAEGSSR